VSASAWNSPSAPCAANNAGRKDRTPFGPSAIPMSNKPRSTVGAASSRRRGFNRANSVTTVRAVGTLTGQRQPRSGLSSGPGASTSRTRRATCPAPLPAANVGACSATHPAVDPACDAEISPRDSASPTTATRAPHATAARASNSPNKVPNSPPWTCHNDATNSATVLVAARISARRDAESRVASMLSITPTLTATTDRPPAPNPLSHNRTHHKQVTIHSIRCGPSGGPRSRRRPTS
jgi:hypothetical protein